MGGSAFIATTSTEVSDTWSHKARSGSPSPPLQAGQNATTQSGGPFTIKESQENCDKTAQNNALRGVGSQFLAIDDEVKNQSLQPDLQL
ncbi:hypothetical protein GGI43DRAFT_380270 [Trichoderma evansii]